MSGKILWGEGLFLRPQHFQQQDHYHEERLHRTAALLHPYAWGVGALQVDRDALANETLRVLELSLRFPDGELYAAPGADELPDAERMLMARREWQEVEAAIADMPDRMAIALRMFRLEEQPQRAIAEHLGISISGVEKLLQRAYRKIHDRLDRFAEDSEAARRQHGERGTDRAR